VTTLLDRLPRGAELSPEALAQRHRINSVLLYLHPPVLLLVGILNHRSAPATVGLALVPAAFALAAALSPRIGPACDLTGIGLMSSTYVGIELSGGRVEAHFHLYVILVFVALYQRRTAFAFAVGSVLVHHLGLGLTVPDRVFGHGDHEDFAMVAGMVAYHASLLVLEIVGILFVWHFAEQSEIDNERLAEQARRSATEAEAERTAAAQRENQAAEERGRQLATLTEDLAGQAGRIQAAAQQVTTAVAGVQNRTAVLADSVQDISDRAQRAAGTAERGRVNASEAAGGVGELERRMGEISSVNALISQLADQTHLLALNAAIEAARAGEHGRGFNVVANEVKALAGETARSSGQVGAVIANVVTETRSVASGFAATSEVVGQIHALQVDIAGSVEEQLATLREISDELAFAAQAATGIAADIDRMARTTGTA
jgi:methyl-accepting chemotaxis protein